MILLTLLAQEGEKAITVPNAMGAHTWFIIIAVGSFLAWSISYSLQLHKEALKRKGRAALMERKEQLIDLITELETQKEAGSITERNYKQELKDLKFRLSKIIGELGSRS